MSIQFILYILPLHMAVSTQRFLLVSFILVFPFACALFVFFFHGPSVLPSSRLCALVKTPDSHPARQFYLAFIPLLSSAFLSLTLLHIHPFDFF